MRKESYVALASVLVRVLQRNIIDSQLTSIHKK